MRRPRLALHKAALAAAPVAGRLMRGLPGLAALACAVAGVWLLAGLGWALVAAVPFLLLADHRAP